MAVLEAILFGVYWSCTFSVGVRGSRPEERVLRVLRLLEYPKLENFGGCSSCSGIIASALAASDSRWDNCPRQTPALVRQSSDVCCNASKSRSPLSMDTPRNEMMSAICKLMSTSFICSLACASPQTSCSPNLFKSRSYCPLTSKGPSWRESRRSRVGSSGRARSESALSSRIRVTSLAPS